MIDLDQKISQHFTWREALWLPQWNRAANEFDGLTSEIKRNLVSTFLQMDVVRNYFDSPLIVHCAYRPDKYNLLVNGAANSAHKTGEAVDFHVQSISCINAQKMILAENKLEQWLMRMEDGTPTWIHLDRRDVSPGGSRCFKP